MSDTGEKITRELTIRYVSVLVVLGGLAIGSFLGLGRIMIDAESGTALVNLAGRQRMLVERVAFSATRLAVSGLPADERAEAERILGESLDALESSHAGLIAGMPEMRGSKPPSDKLKALYFGPDGDVDARLKTYSSHARALLARARGPVAANDRDLGIIVREAGGPLLSLLERVTGRYQRENEERLINLSAMHGSALVIILGLLMLSAAIVFRPMATRIRTDIETRARVEKRLRESEERLWCILEESPVGVSVSRRGDGSVVFVNSRFCDIIGASRDDVLGGAARSHYVDDAQRQQVIGALKGKGRLDDVEVEFRRRDGSAFWGLLTIRPTKFEGEMVNLAWLYDISAIKQTEEKLRLTAKVVESASEAVVITNIDNVIEFVNPAFTTITEYSRDEVMGRNPAILRSGRHDADFYRSMWEQISRNGRWRGEIWNRRKSGEFYAEWLSIVALKDDAGTTTHHIAIFSDITHRKEDEERVWRQANYDALTGLPNRALFIDRLAQAGRQGRREDKKFAVLFIDLDGFKQVNDTLGHAAGDILLQQTGVRLSECMRASDTVARLAGDEFTCILFNIRDREDVSRIATKMLERLGEAYDLEGQTAHVHGSIGIAVFPDDAGDTGALMTLADQAMYRVKKRGKNNYEFADCAALRNS